MSLDKLLAAGAQVCGGSVILGHKTLGSLQFGELVLTAEGDAFLLNASADDAVVVKETPKRRAKAEPVPETPAE